MIDFTDFTKVDMRIGTIIDAKPNEKAIKPSYILSIDLGELGIKTSSAQITQHYQPHDLIDLQVCCVVNFPPKRVAGVKSEVLVLACVCDDNGTVLLNPTHQVRNGGKIS